MFPFKGHSFGNAGPQTIPTQVSLDIGSETRFSTDLTPFCHSPAPSSIHQLGDIPAVDGPAGTMCPDEKPYTTLGFPFRSQPEASGDPHSSHSLPSTDERRLDHTNEELYAPASSPHTRLVPLHPMQPTASSQTSLGLEPRFAPLFAPRGLQEPLGNAQEIPRHHILSQGVSISQSYPSCFAQIDKWESPHGSYSHSRSRVLTSTPTLLAITTTPTPSSQLPDALSMGAGDTSQPQSHLDEGATHSGEDEGMATPPQSDAYPDLRSEGTTCEHTPPSDSASTHQSALVMAPEPTADQLMHIECEHDDSDSPAKSTPVKQLSAIAPHNLPTPPRKGKKKQSCSPIGTEEGNTPLSLPPKKRQRRTPKRQDVENNMSILQWLTKIPPQPSKAATCLPLSATEPTPTILPEYTMIDLTKDPSPANSQCSRWSQPAPLSSQKPLSQSIPFTLPETLVYTTTRMSSLEVNILSSSMPGGTTTSTLQPIDDTATATATAFAQRRPEVFPLTAVNHQALLSGIPLATATSTRTSGGHPSALPIDKTTTLSHHQFSTQGRGAPHKSLISTSPAKAPTRSYFLRQTRDGMTNSESDDDSHNVDENRSTAATRYPSGDHHQRRTPSRAGSTFSSSRTQSRRPGDGGMSPNDMLDDSEDSHIMIEPLQLETLPQTHTDSSIPRKRGRPKRIAQLTSGSPPVLGSGHPPFKGGATGSKKSTPQRKKQRLIASSEDLVHPQSGENNNDPPAAIVDPPPLVGHPSDDHTTMEEDSNYVNSHKERLSSLGLNYSTNYVDFIDQIDDDTLIELNSAAFQEYGIGLSCTLPSRRQGGLRYSTRVQQYSPDLSTTSSDGIRLITPALPTNDLFYPNLQKIYVERLKQHKSWVVSNSSPVQGVGSVDKSEVSYIPYLQLLSIHPLQSHATCQMNASKVVRLPVLDGMCDQQYLHQHAKLLKQERKGRKYEDSSVGWVICDNPACMKWRQLDEEWNHPQYYCGNLTSPDPTECAALDDWILRCMMGDYAFAKKVNDLGISTVEVLGQKPHLIEVLRGIGVAFDIETQSLKRLQ